MKSQNEFVVRFLDEEDGWPTNGWPELLELTQVGDHLYRIDSVVDFVESARIGDVIEVEQLEDGELLFVRVAQQGGWSRCDWCLPRYLIESEYMAAIWTRITAFGGHSVRLMGGILIVCLPPGTDYNPTSDIDRADKVLRNQCAHLREGVARCVNRGCKHYGYPVRSANPYKAVCHYCRQNLAPESKN